MNDNIPSSTNILGEGLILFYSMQELKKSWGVSPQSILHVGAHKAEEADAYVGLGARNITWIDAQSREVENLKANLDPKIHTVIQAAVWETSGITKEFYVTSNSESSSLLELGTHKEKYPQIIVTDSMKLLTTTLDDLFTDMSFDFVNLDIQGAELQALRGFKLGLRSVKWIYMEVNSQPLYKDSPLIGEIDDFLMTQGFERRGQRWWKNDGWGDAIYIRTGEEYAGSIIVFIYSILQELKWKLSNLARILLRK